MAQDTASGGKRRFTTEELKDAGASEDFVSMYLSTAGDRRHSIREELNEGYGGDVLADGGDPTRASGGFFRKLWDGHTFDAFLHADGDNTRIMLDVLGAQKIMEQGVNVGGYGLAYAKRMVNQNAESVGMDGL